MMAFLDATAVAGFAYACHAAVAALVAWVSTRWFRSPVHRAQLWSAAILVPIATVALQLMVPGERWAIGVPERATLSADAAAHGPVAIARSGRTASIRLDRTAERVPMPPSLLRTGARAAAAVWLAGAALFAIRLTVAAVTQRRRLAARRPTEDEWILAEAVRLARASGLPRVAVTVSDTIDVPAALQGEVCLPARATGLPASELRAVLAHEIAHIARRDPAILLAAELARLAGWCHPLVGNAIRAFRREIEFCCDDSAVSAVGDPLALARALRSVAAWRVRDAGVLRAAATSRGELIHVRVQRLLTAEAQPPQRAALPVALALAALMAAGCLMLPALRLAPDILDIHTEGATVNMRRLR